VNPLKPRLGNLAGFFYGAPSMSAHLRVQVPLRAGHSEQSEVQLHKGDRMWEGSVERKSRADEQEQLIGVRLQLFTKKSVSGLFQIGARSSVISSNPGDQ